MGRAMGSRITAGRCIEPVKMAVRKEIMKKIVGKSQCGTVLLMKLAR